MTERYQLHYGDCLEVLRTLPDNSVDAVVTDPPYGLSFMGKKWDYDVPSEDIWCECLRVLKPGGHLLAFAGTRTQHRMAVRIEDAGFEIRDMIAWVYGSGFPKSLDVSKAIDKRGGSVAGFEQFRDAVRAAMKRNGVSRAQLQAALGNYMLSHYLTAGSQPAVPNLRDYRIIRDTVQLGPEFDALFNDEAERDVVGQQAATRLAVAPGQDNDRSNTTLAITAPATPEAQQWAGWGTALKPALEPITVARKPFAGTVANNVLTWGTGAVNVDGSRIPTKGDNPGRWPANLIHDGSEEVVGLFPSPHGAGSARQDPGGGTFDGGKGWGNIGKGSKGFRVGDSGSAARFFYCAKASKGDRGHGNNHPTVKPTDLMRYLCRLVTPPGGVVLDPFTGSGSTGKGAILEGFRFVGIEREAEYIDIARARIQHAVDLLPNTLFDNNGE